MTAPAPVAAPDGDARRERARGAFLGLAVGDAAGFPSLYHRTVRLARRRSILWRFALLLDEQQVLRMPLPFTGGRPEPLALSGTDDSEFLAVAALVLLEVGGDFSSGPLFEGWQRHVVDAADQIWSGISERSSIVNARRGLVPPATGNDNPAHYDDGAVARAVAVGARFPGDTGRAAQVATAMAEITNAADGVWAAAAMGAAIAAAVGGGGWDEALDAALRQVPPGSWLSRQIDLALRLEGEASSAFALAAELSDRVANASYSFGAVAPETLASALALSKAAGGDPMVAVPAAATVAKQADSVPAMVGALTGALSGARALPAAWTTRVDRLRGICVPALEGLSLVELADALVAAHEQTAAGPEEATDN
jgi:ADP-ribosylglycohydrolase